MPEQSRPRISVRLSATGCGVWCDDPASSGSVVLEFDGAVTSTPARSSVQVGFDEHVHPDETVVASQDRSRFLWRFLNHSCAPSCWVAGRTLIALRDLAAGDELTFDYNATEWCMAEPFACLCGACDGSMIRGYAHLDVASRVRRKGWIAEYLVERMADADA
jgi:hypothetical protein